MLRSPVVAAALTLGCLLPLPWQAQPCADATYDNRDGYLVNLEEGPQHPMELVDGGSELWVANIPDGSVSVFELAPPAAPVLAKEIAVGLGPVTIRKRPEVGEVWVVCQSSNAIFVLDQGGRFVKRAVRVASEPVDLVFDGDSAYVSLPATHQIAKINLATVDDPAQPVDIQLFDVRSALPSIGNETAAIEEPRALRLHATDGLHVLSFKSGNGTAVRGPGQGIDDRWAFFDTDPVNFDPPADRDVLRFDLANLSEPGVAVAWRMGTLNFDFLFAPNGDLLVSNVDLHNTLFGEFQLQEQGFADHRISRLAPSASGDPNSPPAIIDLNVDAHPSLLSDGYGCSMPTEMALTADGETLYVACYETHNVAVVDLTTGQVTAELRPSPAPGPGGAFGARGLALDQDQDLLYVYFRGNSRLATFDTSGLTLGTIRKTTVSEQDLGLDITPAKAQKGRFHFIDAGNSGLAGSAALGSCNTCHPDGHLDGLAWELGDFTGAEHSEPRDDKGMKVTMSLRGIEETPPYHWRGDRADLKDFNPAFEGLLGGNQLSSSEMRELEAFVFSISYPPNPLQALDREYSTPACDGLDLYLNKPSFDPFADTASNQVSLTCVQCHGLDGVSGTNNQVTNVNSPDTGPGPNFQPLMLNSAQLRGLPDKMSDTAQYLDGSSPNVFLPVSGFGFTNSGQTPTLMEHLAHPGFSALSLQEQLDIAQLLNELDTGLAPTTALAVTLGEALGSGAPTVQDLLDGADAGHNDVVVRGRIEDPPGSGTFLPVGMLYLPGSAPASFQADRASLGTLLLTELQAMVAANAANLTFIGTPVKSGYRLGLDRDMDFLADGDDPNTSGLTLGGPSQFSSTAGLTEQGPGGPLPPPGPPPPPAPAILDVQVRWVNSNAAKVEWRTDAPSNSGLATLDATGQVLWSGNEPKKKEEHVMVARGLLPGQPMTLRIQSRASNSGGISFNFKTASVSPQDFLFDAVHVASTEVIGDGSGQATVTFTLVDNDGQPAVGYQVLFDCLQWSTINTDCNPPPLPQLSEPADANGESIVSLTYDPALNLEVIARLVGSPPTVPVPNLLYFHPLNGQFGFWDDILLP